MCTGKEEMIWGRLVVERPKLEKSSREEIDKTTPRERFSTVIMRAAKIVRGKKGET